MTRGRTEVLEEIKRLPLNRRDVTQIVIGLETMLENLVECHHNPEIVRLISPNYHQHVAQLKRQEEYKMADFYTQAYSHFMRAYQ